MVAHRLSIDIARCKMKANTTPNRARDSHREIDPTNATANNPTLVLLDNNKVTNTTWETSKTNGNNGGHLEITKPEVQEDFKVQEEVDNTIGQEIKTPQEVLEDQETGAEVAPEAQVTLVDLVVQATREGLVVLETHVTREADRTITPMTGMMMIAPCQILGSQDAQISNGTGRLNQHRSLTPSHHRTCPDLLLSTRLRQILLTNPSMFHSNITSTNWLLLSTTSPLR